jgi:HSP20 family protein
METKTFDEVKTDNRDITKYDNNYQYVIPRCDISETSDCFVIELEMPGTKKESLSVKLQNGHLVVDGKMVTQDHGKLVYSEIPRRNYHRVFKLSNTVDANSIEAKWNEGVLTLNLKKKEETKPHEININF